MTNNVLRRLESQSRSPDFRAYAVEEALPGFMVQEYPRFVEFLKAYAEWLRDTEGFGDLINLLIDARDVEVAAPALREALKNELGPDFPNLNGIDEAVLVRLFEYWYRAKGTPDAVEAYFKLFLGTTAEVVLPSEQMLRCSDGEWFEAEGRWLSSKGILSDGRAVIQDSYYYQIYSYLVRSGMSVLDWGPTFEKLAHPAGWIYFGEVRVESLARFEEQTFSPTIQPGLQTRDANLLLFSLVAIAQGADPQTIIKFWNKVAPRVFTHSYQDVGINLYDSTYTIHSFADVILEDLISESPTLHTERRRPARILITT